MITQKMGNPADLITRDISENCFIMYIKNMTDRRYTSEGIILPLMENDSLDSFKGEFEKILTCAAVISEDNIDTLITMLLRGSVVVAIKSDRIYTAFCPADTFVGRAVSEPESDVTVRGPKAGFTENGENNVSMLRKIIRTDKLRVEMLSVGKTAQTTIFLCYVEGRADKKTLKIIKERLNNFSEEYIIDSANLETVIEGKRSKMFPSMGSTEKVDKAASKLLSGRIGIICDGSPYVLTAPYYFIEAFQSAEDYLKNPWYSSFLRFVRFFAVALNI
jgi:spore germination protein KA